MAVDQYRMLDVKSECKAVSEFMKGASVERKIALVAWALSFLSELGPFARSEVVRACGDVNAQLGGKAHKS